MRPARAKALIINAFALTGRFAIFNPYRECQKSKLHAPKGQKHIAQGTALGKSITNTNAPCRGKSVNYQCFCPYRAF